MDPNQLLQKLLQLLSGGGAGGQQAFNPYTPWMNQATTGSLQPNLLQSLLGGVFPGLQAQVPPTVLMSNAAEMQRRDELRQRSINQYYMSPNLTRMLRGIGISNDQLRGPGNQLNFTGNLLSSLYNNTLGRAIDDPFIMRGQMANQMRDVFAGRFFGRGAGGFQGPGLTETEVQAQTNRMFSLTQRGLFQRGSFGAAEMFEVQQLGARRGLFTGANVNDVTRRTTQLARTIKMGQAVFQTMDKEGVLEALQQITQGQVPLADTGSLNRVMFRVAAMAKAANASVQMMSRVAAEGAQLFRQVGIGGTVGAEAFMASARMTQMMSSAGPGRAPIFSAADIAGAGGRRAVSALFQQEDISLFGSQYFQNNAWLVTQMGGLTNAQLGAAGVDRAAVTEAFRTGRMTSGQQRDLLTAIRRARGVSYNAAVAMMQAGREQAAENLMQEGDPFENFMIMQRANFRSLMGLMRPEDRDLFRGQKLKNSNLDGARRAVVMQAVGRQSPQLNTRQRALVADRYAASVGAEMKGDGSLVKFRSEWMRDQSNIRRTAVVMETMERMRPTGTFASAVFRGMGGDMSAAAFVQSFGEVLTGVTGEGQIGAGALDRMAIAMSRGEDFSVEITERNVTDYLLSRVSAAQFSSMGKTGHDLFALLGGLQGRTAFSASQGLQQLERSQKLIKDGNKANLDGIDNNQRKKVQQFFEGKNINLRTIDEASKKFQLGNAQVFRLAKESSAAAAKNFEDQTREALKITSGPAIGADVAAITTFGALPVTSMGDMLAAGQGLSQDMARLMVKIKRDGPESLTPEEKQRLVDAANKSSGKKHKNFKEAYEYTLKNTDRGARLKEDQIDFRGRAFKEHMRNPAFVVATAKKMVAFQKVKKEELLEKQLGATALGAMSKEELGALARQVREARTPEEIAAAQEALGRLGIAGPEQAAAAMRVLGEVGGFDPTTIRTGQKIDGLDLKFGQVQAAKDSGALDIGRKAQKTREDQLGILRKIYEALTGQKLSETPERARRPRRVGVRGSTGPGEETGTWNPANWWRE